MKKFQTIAIYLLPTLYLKYKYTIPSRHCTYKTKNRAGAGKYKLRARVVKYKFGTGARETQIPEKRYVSLFT